MTCRSIFVTRYSLLVLVTRCSSKAAAAAAVSASYPASIATVKFCERVVVSLASSVPPSPQSRWMTSTTSQYSFQCQFLPLHLSSSVLLTDWHLLLRRFGNFIGEPEESDVEDNAADDPSQYLYDEEPEEAVNDQQLMEVDGVHTRARLCSAPRSLTQTQTKVHPTPLFSTKTSSTTLPPSRSMATTSKSWSKRRTLNLSPSPSSPPSSRRNSPSRKMTCPPSPFAETS